MKISTIVKVLKFIGELIAFCIPFLPKDTEKDNNDVKSSK